jgi:hypothetical protein
VTEEKLNTILINTFPEIKQKFDDYVSWQDGIKTGCFLTFEDVFMPFFLEAINAGNTEIISRSSEFIEMLFASGDEYAENVIYVGVLESLKSQGKDEKFADILKPKTRKAFLEIEY